jgi:hypothetical protein
MVRHYGNQTANADSEKKWRKSRHETDVRKHRFSVANGCTECQNRLGCVPRLKGFGKCEIE